MIRAGKQFVAPSMDLLREELSDQLEEGIRFRLCTRIYGRLVRALELLIGWGAIDELKEDFKNE
jgi:hypothetical protein